MHKAISADGIELKVGQKIWHIYFPNEVYKVGHVAEDNYIWVDNMEGKYDHAGKSDMYSANEQFAIKNAIKYQNSQICLAEKELDTKKQYLNSLIERMTL